MQLTLTGPIEAFIQRQIAQGYRDGEEVSRATGPNADLSLDRFIEEQTAGLP